MSVAFFVIQFWKFQPECQTEVLVESSYFWDPFMTVEKNSGCFWSKKKPFSVLKIILKDVTFIRGVISRTCHTKFLSFVRISSDEFQTNAIRAIWKNFFFCKNIINLIIQMIIVAWKKDLLGH